MNNMVVKDEINAAVKTLSKASARIIRGHSLFKKRFRILKDLLRQGRHDNLSWQLLDILFSADEDAIELNGNMSDMLIDHAVSTDNVPVSETMLIADLVISCQLNEVYPEVIVRLEESLEKPLYYVDRARMRSAVTRIENMMYDEAAELAFFTNALHFGIDSSDEHDYANDSDDDYTEGELVFPSANVGLDGHHLRCPLGNAASPDVVLLLPTIDTVSECHICKDHDTEQLSVKLPCEHTFHQKCVRRWFQSSNSCPLCKKELPRMSELTDESPTEELDFAKHLPLGKVIRLSVMTQDVALSHNSGDPKIYFVNRKGIVLSSETKKAQNNKSRAYLKEHGPLPGFLAKLDFGTAVTARVMLDNQYLPTIGPATFKRNFEDQDSPMQVLAFLCLGSGQYAKSSPRAHVEAMQCSLEPNVTYV